MKVKNYPDLVKDPRSGAVINTNTQEMETAKTRKLRQAEKDKRLAKVENDVIEIKEMLGLILSKL